MKEVIIYEKLEEGQVKCAVCSHRCKIEQGSKGICGVRENRQGILYALNYEKTIAMNVDPIEKKPLYHFMPGTKTYSLAAVGCNFKCHWCQNWQISQVYGGLGDDGTSSSPKLVARATDGVVISPEEHIQRALDTGCPSISYTYTEPTIFLEYALDIMKLAKEKGLKNVWVSNGYMTQETLEYIIPYLDAVNIDFKGPQKGIYEKYCGGKAEYVMESIKTLYRNSIHLEVTTLVIPGVNDENQQLKDIVDFIVNELDDEVPWHISRFYPSWKMSDTPITPMKALIESERIGKDAGLKHIFMGNV